MLLDPLKHLCNAAASGTSFAIVATMDLPRQRGTTGGALTRRCGALTLPDGSVCWRVWAPRAEYVDLVLFNRETPRSLSMTREGHGFFRHVEPEVPEGQRYAYRLDGGPDRPDPCSLWQPEGVHRPSAVFRPERFRWTDQDWKGVRREDLVFYELHVGLFTPQGTFEAVIPRLSELRALGITAVELMPVGQFPGPRNWGYDGVHLYAAQHSYGGPHGLQKLVDACHAAGLAIYLDVVYNHLGPEGNYLNEFGPYFTDRYRNAWGQAVNYDGTGCDAVRDFVLDNARMWLEEFHFDGLRLDAVHAIIDLSPKHILRAIKETAEQATERTGRPALIIAESNLNDPRLLLPVERGGFNLDAQWSDDFHHAVHAYLTGEQQGYYEDFGQAGQLASVLAEPFLFAGNYSRYRGRRHGAPSGELSGDRFVIAIQNHDQVGNRARGERLDLLLTNPAQRRLAASLLLLSPHLPLLFMGEEYGEDRPFLFFCSFEDPHLVEAVRQGRKKEFETFAWQGDVPDPHSEKTFKASALSWSWPEGSSRAGMRRLYADLLAARRQWPALRDYLQRASRLVPGPAGGEVLELVRGGRWPEAGKTLQIYLNLGKQSRPLPDADALRQTLLFSSEASRYGGCRPAGETPGELLPFECLVLGPKDWPRPGQSARSLPS
jgi:maltooligosyltrehalose trehalohydrolase